MKIIVRRQNVDRSDQKWMKSIYRNRLMQIFVDRIVHFIVVSFPDGKPV